MSKAKVTEHAFTDYKSARDFMDQMLARGHDAWFGGAGLVVFVKAWDR